jgi:16S rRNA (uracil1498-N3)-methyltransferase
LRRFRVPHIPGEKEHLQLEVRASHHLLNVLRLPRGSELRIFDGLGQHAKAVLVDVVAMRAVLLVNQHLQRLEPPPQVHLLLGIPKGPAMDLAIRMATEAGAREIHPMVCERSVPKGDRSERWTKISESASQQCGRTDVPIIHPPRPITEVLNLPATISDRRIALPNSPPGSQAEGPTAIAIGPEGGFTSSEVNTALSLGYRPVGLGPFVLRTDTAAVVAVAQALGGAA